MQVLSTSQLATTVKDLRIEKGITYLELAKRTNIDQIFISRLEEANFIPSIEQLDSLTKTLNFDSTDLFIEEESHNSFYNLIKDAQTDNEKEGFKKLVEMMLTLRQQVQIRKSYESQKAKV